MSVSFSENNTGSVFVSQTYTAYVTSVEGTTYAQETYTVLYASPTTYKVNITEIQGSNSLSAIAWILKNGDAVAYSYLGQNITSSEATGLYEGLMTPFFVESQYSLIAQTLTTANGVHASGGTTARIGSANVALTNYTAETLPLTVSTCDGGVTLSALSVQIGAPQGAKLSLITGLNVSGQETYDSQTDQIYSLSFRVTSVSLA